MKILKESSNLDHFQDYSLDQQFFNLARLSYFEVQKILRFLGLIFKTVIFKCLILGCAISNSVYGTISSLSVNKNEPLAKIHQFYK
jgi:hypothetical protein